MVFKALILAFIQSVTEFLPISSSGHLLLVEKLFSLKEFGLSFNVLIHLGSALALIIFFAKDWLEIFKNARENFFASLLFKIIIALVPALIFGLILEKFQPVFWQSKYLVIFNLIFFGLILLWADKHNGEKATEKLSLKQIFLIGIFQALALVPGVSRSGVTITIALFLGLTRKESARFSFLLATPAILGANLLELSNLSGNVESVLSIYLIGFLASFILSYITIAWFLKYLQKNKLWPFAIWRFIIAIAAILLIIFIQ